MRIPRWGLPLAAAALLTFAAPAPADAAWWDIFSLPGEVNELREEYDNTKTRLEEVTRQSQETIEQYRLQQERLIETQEQMSLDQERMSQDQERMESENKRLIAQNERLIAQNEELSQAVVSLQRAEEARAKHTARIWSYVYVGLGLVALYLLLGRFLRLFLRSRQFRI